MKKFFSIIFYNSLIFLFFYTIYVIGYKTVAFKFSDFFAYLLFYNFLTLSYLGILSSLNDGKILKYFIQKQNFDELLNECKKSEDYLNSHIKKRKIFDLFCTLYQNLNLNGLSDCLFNDYRLYLSDIKNIEEENDKKIEGFIDVFNTTAKNILKKYPKDE